MIGSPAIAETHAAIGIGYTLTESSKMETDHDNICIYGNIRPGQMGVGVMAKPVFNEKAFPFEANPPRKDEVITRALLQKIEGRMGAPTS